jgi:hypothetical protein
MTSRGQSWRDDGCWAIFVSDEEKDANAYLGVWPSIESRLRVLGNGPTAQDMSATAVGDCRGSARVNGRSTRQAGPIDNLDVGGLVG